MNRRGSGWAKRARVPFALFVVLLSASAAMSAGGVISSYDAVTEFSTSVNTSTSTWSYRAATVHGGTYTLMDKNAPGSSFSPGPQPLYWSLTTSGGSAGAGLPSIGINNTNFTQTYTPAPTFVWPNNTLVMHPDGPQEYAVLSWLSPGEGYVDIRTSFADAHPVGTANTGIIYYVDRNGGVGADSLLSGTVNDSSSSGPLSIGGVQVHTGDRINFLVGLQSILNSNSTFVTAQIDFYVPLTPEPGSLGLVAIAGVGVAGFYYLRRRLRAR